MVNALLIPGVRMSKHAGVLVFLIFSFLTLLWWGSKPQSTIRTPETGFLLNLLGGPMVQLGNTDGQTAILIAWRTRENSTSRVDFGLTPTFGLHVADERLTKYHALKLTGLKPDTRYYYAISSDSKILGSARFQTGKTEHQAYKFAVLGDSGSGNIHQYSVAEQILEQNVDFVLHTGDLVYPNGEEKDYPLRFYLPYRKILERVPFFPAPGNHDYKTASGQPLYDNFVRPGSGAHYSLDYANAHIVSLDCYQVDTGSSRWLAEDLSKTNKIWKFVFLHESPFSNKANRSGNREVGDYWLPVFEKHSVDIVFTGHDHVYTRFRKLRGVYHIIEAVGGSHLYKTGPPTADVEVTDNTEFGFGLVDISGRALRFRHITESGRVLDSLVLEK